MASTTWHDIPNGVSVHLQAMVNYDSISRTNNTIFLNGVNLYMRVSNSGAHTSFRWHGSVQAGYDGGGSNTVMSDREVKASGVDATYLEEFTSSESNASFTVPATATSGFLDASGYNDDTGGSVSQWDLDIPNLGSPTGTDTLEAITSTTQLSTRVNVSSWGANATAGAVRSYIADNSAYTGQTYLATTDNAVVDHTGLVSNTKYWLRGWASNGGGLTAYIGATTGVTLANAPVIGTPTFEATTATIPTTIDTGGGFYTITKQYRYKKTADATWGSWTDYTGDDIALTGLAPNTEYQVAVQSITTSGTTTGGTTTFTTLPAAKLVYADGTVVNAIPRRVNADSTTTMLNVNIVEAP